MPLPPAPQSNHPNAAREWLLRALAASDSTAVLTGSGISAACGLATYRSAGSPWPGIARLQHADTYRDNLPALWAVWSHVRETSAAATPSPAHAAITDLQRLARARGATFTVFTQNVDGLHTKAGTDTIEVHGSLHRTVCERCHMTGDYPSNVIVVDGVPRCPTCTGALRPDMTLFGEQPKRTSEVIATLQSAELLFVVGTSGTVDPVASLPSFAARNGARVILINDQPWENMSPFSLGFGDDCQQFIPQLAAAATMVS